MTTSRVRWALLGAAVFVAASLISAASAKDELPKAVRVIRNILSEERHLSTSNWDRRQQFREELTSANGSATELRWHCGYVETDDGWKAVEALGLPNSQRGRFDEYLQRRQSTSRNSEDQWKLANWCSSVGLPEQGEAHLFQSILLSPPSLDISERLKRLQYRRLDEKLVSPFEFAELEREAEAYTRDFNQWLPKVKRLTTSIKGEHDKSAGLSLKVKDIAQHAAVPAIEQILASANEVQSKVLIEALGQTQSYRATQTLARVAMLSPTLQIRDWAIKELQTRKKDDYVPGLIGLLRCPVAQQVQTAVGPRGEKELRIVWTAEDSSTIQVLDLRVMDYTTMNRWTNITSLRNPSIRGPRRIDNSPADFAKAHEVRTALIRLDAWAELANLEAEATSDRVNSILRVACDSQDLNTPHDWWSWWANYEDVDASPKRVVVVKEEQQLGRYVPPTIQVSCLVGGTPVWTERGLMPIEQIRIGDRVLSKSVETGELALKPVLHTTYRPPRKTTRFELGSDAIQATGGHRFWVSGSGWVRTRELNVNQPLHTTTGITRITAVQSAESAPTFNLVVADFHTYFVGKSGILSHDVLPPKPTNKLVPGLSE